MIKNFKQKLENDIHLKEVIHGSLTFFILRIFGMVVSYAFTLFVTRSFGAFAWGIFALSFSVLQIVSVIGKLGLDTAIIKFIAEYNAQGRIDAAKKVYVKASFLVVFVSFFLFLFLFWNAPILAKKVFNKPYLTFYFRLISLALIPLVLLSINSESLRALKKIKEYAIFQNIFPYVCTFIFLFIFLYVFDIKNVKTIFIAYILGILVSFWFSLFLINKKFLNRKINYEEKLKVSLKEILSVSIPMLLSSSLFMIMCWADTIMLGIWRTEKEVGIYNVAVKLSLVTSFFLASVNSIVAPKFAEFWGKRDLEGLKRVAQQSTKLIFWTSAPILILYLIFPKWFMGLFGEEFRKGALALMFLTIGQFVNASVGSVGYILQMTGKQKIFQNIMFIGCGLNIIANIILIPILGMVGAAISSTIAYSFINIVPLFLVRYFYGFYTIPIIGGRC